MKKAIRHLKTITHHKILVMTGCFRVGLVSQGILHDLSKLLPTEFLVGAKYYQGVRSPNNAEREEKGYSSSWLHHKGRNKHHYEYWIDYSLSETDGSVKPIPMPVNYVVEMFMDRVAASKVYEKENYTDAKPLEYLEKMKCPDLMNPKTYRQLRVLLAMLAKRGEKETFCYIRNTILKNKIR